MKRVPKSFKNFLYNNSVPQGVILGWKIRKLKYYNPNGKCRYCSQAVSKQQHICWQCTQEERWQREETLDYHDTINSIRSDWYR
jgi:hypothetical protein